jgi:hypothetical protein
VFVTLCQYEQNSVRVLSDVLMRYWVYGQRELILVLLEGVCGHSSEVCEVWLLFVRVGVLRAPLFITGFRSHQR